MSDLQCAYVQDILKKKLIGLLSSRDSGDVLYFLRIDDSLRIELFSNFIAAISMFGDEVGKFKRMFIEGINYEINIIFKHGLIITIFFPPNTNENRDLDLFEQTLDLFYDQFKTYLQQGKCNQAIYERFDNIMCQIIRKFLIKLGIIKE